MQIQSTRFLNYCFLFILLSFSFVNGNSDSQNEPSKKSAPIPEHSNGNVQSLVYDNFVQNVVESAKDSIVLYFGKHAKCPDCYAAIQNFEIAANELVGSKISVSFFKYNVDENYLTQAVSRLPEIYLYKKGEVMRFPDEYPSKQSIIKWVKSKYSHIHDEL